MYLTTLIEIPNRASNHASIRRRDEEGTELTNGWPWQGSMSKQKVEDKVNKLVSVYCVRFTTTFFYTIQHRDPNTEVELHSYPEYPNLNPIIRNPVISLLERSINSFLQYLTHWTDITSIQSVPSRIHKARWPLIWLHRSQFIPRSK